MSVPVVVALVGPTWPVAAATVALVAPPTDRFFFFGLVVYVIVRIYGIHISINATNLVPGPDGSETVHKRNVFPEVGVEPQTRRDGKVGDAEEDNTEDSHGEEQTEEAEETPGEVVDALAQLQRPQRVENDDKDDDKGEGGVKLALHLAALPKPDIVHVITSILLLLDSDVPLTLDALSLLAIGADLGLNFIHSQSKHA